MKNLITVCKTTDNRNIQEVGYIGKSNDKSKYFFYSNPIIENNEVLGFELIIEIDKDSIYDIENINLEYKFQEGYGFSSFSKNLNHYNGILLDDNYNYHYEQSLIIENGKVIKEDELYILNNQPIECKSVKKDSQIMVIDYEYEYEYGAYYNLDIFFIKEEELKETIKITKNRYIVINYNYGDYIRIHFIEKLDKCDDVYLWDV